MAALHAEERAEREARERAAAECVEAAERRERERREHEARLVREQREHEAQLASEQAEREERARREQREWEEARERREQAERERAELLAAGPAAEKLPEEQARARVRAAFDAGLPVRSAAELTGWSVGWVSARYQELREAHHPHLVAVGAAGEETG